MWPAIPFFDALPTPPREGRWTTVKGQDGGLHTSSTGQPKSDAEVLFYVLLQ